MKITIENTSKFATLDGVLCRIWEGTTEKGIKMHAFIPLIGVERSEDGAEFERDLKEVRAPSPAVTGYPARLVL